MGGIQVCQSTIQLGGQERVNLIFVSLLRSVFFRKFLFAAEKKEDIHL